MHEVLDPVNLYHTPSPKPQINAGTPHNLPIDAVQSPSPSGKVGASPTHTRDPGPSVVSPVVKPKRAARACDVCRTNHRKCPGPAPGSESCQRCIRQKKVCTWNEHKARMARQASGSPSPKTPKSPRKISIRRSKSLPAAQLSTPQHHLPLLKNPASSSSPSSSSSEEGSVPRTPVDHWVPLPTNAQKHGESTQASRIQLPHLPPTTSHGLPAGPQQQCVQAELLPEWYIATLAVANKYNLLFFPMCLDSWEERQLRGDGASEVNVGLQCVTPSYIDPPPTRQEAMDMLDVLRLEMGTLPYAAPIHAPITYSPPFAGRRIESPLPSDDGPLADVASTDDDGVGSTLPSSPLSGPFVASTQLTTIKTVDSDDAMSQPEPEPDFSFDNSINSSNDSWHFESMSPHRLESQINRFDPFLYSPCKCFASPIPRNDSTPSTSKETYDSSIDSGQMQEAFWDEGMPDVLTDASNEMALDQCLRIDEVLSLV